MSKPDYGAFFGPIEPLADAIRTEDERCWGNGTEKDKQAHDYVLYLGCNVLRTVALAETIGAILNAMHVDYVPLGGPSSCCGIIHHAGGDIEVSEGITRQTFHKFAGYEPKAILTYCPSCHTHMDYVAAETDIELRIPYLHVTEYIVDNLDRLHFAKRVERKVIFHAHGDDEQAKRDSRFARAILGAIPGLEVTEASGGAEWGHDCGNLQIGKVGPENHAALVDALFERAAAEGADAVTALYHSCYRNLCPQEKTKGIEVIHYTQLVAEAMGLTPREEVFKRLKNTADGDAAFAELASVVERRGLNAGRVKKSLDAHFGRK